ARTYAGLPVLGGDLVVHQAESGAWEGRSQSLDRDLTLSTRAAVARAAAGAAALATSAITRSITGERVSSSRLVVGAVDGTLTSP
ncbi:MAG: peptidase M4 family protein, partial [Nocardioidaceae bacterium]